MKAKTLYFNTFNRLFIAYPKTGEIRNRVARGRRAKAGELATTRQGYGYLRIRLNGQSYQAHRVMWLLVHGYVPDDMSINHENQDRTDNRIGNLSLATASDQSKDKSLSKRNTSGHIGVCWNKRDNKWKASITVKRKTDILGNFDKIEDAIAVRKIAEQNYNFHKNHGKKPQAPKFLPDTKVKSNKVTGVYYNVPSKSYNIEVRVNKEQFYIGCNPDRFEAICIRKSAENKIKNHNLTNMSDDEIKAFLKQKVLI